MLAARLEWFDPTSFDLAKTVTELGIEADDEKRKLLELIASVHAADQVLDIDEDSYLRKVAEALGLPRELYEDLPIQDLSIESVRGAAVALLEAVGRKPGRKKPRPLPKT